LDIVDLDSSYNTFSAEIKVIIQNLNGTNIVRFFKREVNSLEKTKQVIEENWPE